MTLEQLAIAAVSFSLGVGFAILFGRWLLWHDWIIETKAHGEDEDYPEGEIRMYVGDDELDALLDLDLDMLPDGEPSAALRPGRGNPRGMS